MNYMLSCLFVSECLGSTNLSSSEKYLELYKDDALGPIREKYKGPDIPSHDALNDLVNRLDPQEMEAVLKAFTLDHAVLKEGDIYSMDGTASIASTDKIHGQKTFYIFNGVHTATGLVLSARAVGDKENEKTVILQSLAEDDIEGLIVTADALNNSRAVMELITEKGGHFVFPVKGEHRSLRADIYDTIETKVEDCKKRKAALEACGASFDETEKGYDVFTSVDKGHSRKETRTLYLTNDLTGIDREKYPHIRQIGVLTTERITFTYDEEGGIIIRGKNSSNCAIITDLEDYSAEEILRIKREHWSVEVFHNQKDNYLSEDRCTVRNSTGRIICAILRRIFYNYLIFLEDLAPETSGLTIPEKIEWLKLNPQYIWMFIIGFEQKFIELLIRRYEEKIDNLRRAAAEFDSEDKKRAPPLLHLSS